MLYSLSVIVVSAESKLKSFERSATGKSRSSSKPSTSVNRNEDDENDTNDHEEGYHHYHNAFFYRVMRAGHESYAAVTPKDVNYVAPYNYQRENGSPRIPFIRLDSAYQEVDTNIESLHFRLEGGYGPVGLEVKHSAYDEYGEDPASPDISQWGHSAFDEDREDPASLEISQWHALYRMSLGPRIECDIGLGSMTLHGDFKTSGASITLPIAYHAPEYFSLELRPAWGDFDENDVFDIELAGMLNIKDLSLRGGYRWMKAGDVELSGPFAGFSLQW